MNMSTDVNVTVEKDTRLTKRPIKVCMHLTDAAYGDYRVMREATALVEAGYDVTIVNITEEVHRPAEEDISGVHIKNVKMPEMFVPTRWKPWFLVKALNMIVRGAIATARTSTDIYHAHDVKGLPAAYIAAVVNNKPLVFDSHEIPLDDPNIYNRRKISAVAHSVLQFMMPRCTKVMTASPLYAREISNEFHYPNVESILNLPIYREIPPSNRLREKLGLGPEKRIALYQGNIQANRSLDQLVNAAPFLDPDIVIVMMGNAVPETKAQLDKLIAEKGVEDRVKIIPAVPYNDLLNWTTSADIGLTIFQPGYTRSIRYCLPNKLFEYLMAGLPVLSSQLDAIADVLKTYDVGEVLPSLEPKDVAASINALLVDAETTARMRKNALEAAKKRYHWDYEKQLLVQLYKSIRLK